MWEEIEELFKQKISLIKISKLIKQKYPLEYSSASYISKNLKNKGYTIINRQNVLKVSDEECLNLYQKGMSLEKIGKKFNICPDLLSKRLKKINIKINNNQNNRPLDHNCFETINTEEKAYWLGFLFADGYIGLKNNIIEIGLAEKDIEHLNKFKKFVKSENKITTNFKTKSVKFSFSSLKIKNDLIKYGCTPQKSLSLQAPKNIPENLIKHFIRGYFDGDGCITYNKRTFDFCVQTSVIGTESILNFILNNINIKSNITLANKNGNILCKQINFNIPKSIIFLEYIYNDCNIYLDRKFFRYTTFKENNYAVQCRNMLNYEESKTMKALTC